MKIGQDIADAKKEIENLQAAVKAAKEKAASAEAEVGRLEKDMEEFKNNKEGKTEELKVNLTFPTYSLTWDLNDCCLFVEKHHEAEGGSSEAHCGCQDEAEGASDCRS